jgi:hypothetical protein
MSAVMLSSDIEAEILARVFDPANGTWSAEAAQAVLAIGLPDGDRKRMDELAAKARAGTLEGEEELEIEGYRHVCRLLDLMKAKSRAAIKNPAA